MDSVNLEALIPIVAIISTFGFVPATIFVVRHFRLKERELQLEQDAQRWAEKQYGALEMRVQRLESALLSHDPQLRQGEDARLAGLGEGPATSAADEAAGAVQRGPLGKTRT